MGVNEETVVYRLSLFDFPKTEAVVTVRHFDAGERTRRALQSGGVLFGLAVLSVFIPIAHFVLVPSFLVASIVFTMLRLKQARKIVRVHGRCPRCSTEQDFEIDHAPLQGEIELTCTSCRNRVRGAPGSAGPSAREEAGAA
jgi:hypothetical protein